MSGPAPATNNRYLIPDVAEFFMRRMRDVSAGMNCCLIGQVLTFDPATQTITAQVNFQKVIKGIIPIAGNIGEMADQIINTFSNGSGYPNLVNVPIFIYQGGGAYLTFPVKPGDACVIFFCDRDMDIWFETGQIAPPNSERVHNINDAIAFIGIRNLTNPIANYNTVVASLMDETGERLAQSGMMVAYGGAVAPSGWLLCLGQAVSTTQYPLLFAAIGYTYGGGGATFNLPNMAGQIPVGIGGTLGLTLGQEFGEVTHLLTGPESGIQAHFHNISDQCNSQSGSGRVTVGGDSPEGPDPYTDVTGPVDAQVPHNNVQPSVGVNWIIKI